MFPFVTVGTEIWSSGLTKTGDTMTGMTRMRTAAAGVRGLVLAYFRGGTAPRSGLPLPPRGLRQGGRHFSTNEDFVGSGLREAERLEHLGLLPPGVRVMDVGSGPGRFAIGLAESRLEIGDYLGVEVQRWHARWCRRHLSSRDGRFRFVHVDAANARYNPTGAQQRPLPGDSGSFDLVYAFSVFTHMTSPDVRHYLAEARRVLRRDGSFVLTAFVEDDVADEMENPPGYGPLTWEGPLHCVRYSWSFFFDLARRHGFEVQWSSRHSERDGQTLLLLRRDSEA